MTGKKRDERAAREAAAMMASVKTFVDQAGFLAQDTYERLSAYNREVWMDKAKRLTQDAYGLVDKAPEQALLDSAARVINDGGAIAFHLANRALETEVEEDEPRLTVESARFFRSLGELWLRSTLGDVTGSSDVASSERVKTVTFESAVAERTAIRHVSVINRGAEAVDADLVVGQLVDANGNKIKARHVSVAGKQQRVHLEPGRNEVTVKVWVPRGTPSGTYRGVLILQMGGAESMVVLNVEVPARADDGADAST